MRREPRPSCFNAADGGSARSCVRPAASVAVLHAQVRRLQRRRELQCGRRGRAHGRGHTDWPRTRERGGTVRPPRGSGPNDCTAKRPRGQRVWFPKARSWCTRPLPCSRLSRLRRRLSLGWRPQRPPWPRFRGKPVSATPVPDIAGRLVQVKEPPLAVPTPDDLRENARRDARGPERHSRRHGERSAGTCGGCRRERADGRGGDGLVRVWTPKRQLRRRSPGPRKLPGRPQPRLPRLRTTACLTGSRRPRGKGEEDQGRRCSRATVALCRCARCRHERKRVPLLRGEPRRCFRDRTEAAADACRHHGSEGPRFRSARRIRFSPVRPCRSIAAPTRRRFRRGAGLLRTTRLLPARPAPCLLFNVDDLRVENSFAQPPRGLPAFLQERAERSRESLEVQACRPQRLF